MELAFGWNLSPGEGPPSFSPFQPEIEAAAESDHSPPSILLVEDNPADVHLVQEALDEYGVRCRLSVVEDGEKAIRLIESFLDGSVSRPALIVLDLNIPKKSGREVLQFLRQNAHLDDTPVVILSSSQTKKDREETAALGADMYIAKPSNLEDFMRIGGILKTLIEQDPPQA